MHPEGKGIQPLWSESWYFDFAARDGSAGGFVRVGHYPALGMTWWWAYAVAGPVAGVHLERPLTEDTFQLDDPELTMRLATVDGAWQLVAHTARFDLDVHWHPVAEPHHYQRGSRYEQPGWARGTVRVDGTTRPVDGPGQRDHSWGVRDWWRLGWVWCAGWLEDGQRFQATRLAARGRVDPDGYLMAPDGSRGAVHDVFTLAFDDLASARLDLVAPDGRQSVLVRSMCTVHSADGRRGIGWRERNAPVPRSDRSTGQLPQSHALPPRAAG
jgi:hypothetical protein